MPVPGSTAFHVDPFTRVQYPCDDRNQNEAFSKEQIMERMESIKMAMMNEETEMNFYLQAAAKSKNPLAKAMFENLARDEKEHMQRITRLHEKLISDGKWPQDMPIEVAGTDIERTLKNLVGNLSAAEKYDHDDETALRRAIEFEGKGERFYSDLAGVCTNPMEKSFFTFLSNIEREHRLSLIDTLTYLEDPESWLEQHEKIGLDGA